MGKNCLILIYNMDHEYREINEENSISVDFWNILDAKSLNVDEKLAFDKILNRVFSCNLAGFFIDGPGGTRKIYLYKALLTHVRSEGLIAIATASSGVATCILPSYKTAHSKFKIAFVIEDNSICNISKQLWLVQLTKYAKLLL